MLERGLALPQLPQYPGVDPQAVGVQGHSRALAAPSWITGALFCSLALLPTQQAAALRILGLSVEE